MHIFYFSYVRTKDKTIFLQNSFLLVTIVFHIIYYEVKIYRHLLYRHYLKIKNTLVYFWISIPKVQDATDAHSTDLYAYHKFIVNRPDLMFC